MTFMAVDMLGGVFCILSLAFKAEIDILATVSSPPGSIDLSPEHHLQINYAAVVLLDGIVLILALILNPRARRRRERQQDSQPDTADVEKQPRPDTMESDATCVPRLAEDGVTEDKKVRVVIRQQGDNADRVKEGL
jgi:hypothetical protein